MFPSTMGLTPSEELYLYRAFIRCEHGGIDALEMYRREWDDDKKCFGPMPSTTGRRTVTLSDICR
jgi:hypothetical protein